MKTLEGEQTEQERHVNAVEEDQTEDGERPAGDDGDPQRGAQSVPRVALDEEVAGDVSAVERIDGQQVDDSPEDIDPQERDEDVGQDAVEGGDENDREGDDSEDGGQDDLSAEGYAYSAVGRAVAGIAKGFGMEVLAFDPFVGADAMTALGVEHVAAVEALYERSRYVSLHIPATAETKGSIGKDRLMRMPKGATLINTARKEVINEAELLAVLAEREDFRYASDIAPSAETLATIKQKYSNRVYVTPVKLGAQTGEANVNAGLAAARQIVAFFENGERRFVVNP